ERARRHNRPDLAWHHAAARAIEISVVAASPRPTVASVDNANRPDDSAIIVLGAGPGEATVAELPARLAPRLHSRRRLFANAARLLQRAHGRVASASTASRASDTKSVAMA